VARWSEIEAEAPELASLARSRFDAHAHKTLATLRRDGSPRISGIEMEFRDGEVLFGGMWKGVKALDLQRDPRFALHGGSDDPPGWSGDAKIAGRAEEITDESRKAELSSGGAPSGPYHLFRAEIDELVVVRLNASRTKLIIESWHEGRGRSRRER
jgi:Pyridoxamine 5'-phosphate oxidase